MAAFIRAAPILGGPRESDRRSATQICALKLDMPMLRSVGLLASVPVSWSTYNVAVRILYSIPAPPPSPLLNFGNYVVSIIAFQVVIWLRSSLSGRESDLAEDGTDQQGRKSWKQYILAGAELGLYLFLGSTTQLEALKWTSASRAAFLVQTTTIMVPLARTLLGKDSLPKILPSVLLAMVGILCFSFDSLSALSVLALNKGDMLAMLAAVFYSLHVLRLSDLSSQFSSTIELARAKTICQLHYSGALSLAAGAENAWYSSYWSSVTPADLMTTGAVLAWLGLATTAYPQWAQTAGQRDVSPTTASIVYASQPLWASLLAFLVLNERLAPKDLLGGAAIVLASILAVRNTMK